MEDARIETTSGDSVEVTSSGLLRVRYDGQLSLRMVVSLSAEQWRQLGEAALVQAAWMRAERQLSLDQARALEGSEAR